MIDWNRQEIILVFHAVCTTPSESFRLNNNMYPPKVNDLSDLLQKPASVILEKIQHLLYLKTQGQYGNWSGGIKLDREVYEEFNADRERLEFVAMKILNEFKLHSQYYEDIINNFNETEAKEIERLKKEGWAVKDVGNVSPLLKKYSIKCYDRSPTVTAIAKLRADFRCEIKGCKYEPFIGIHNLPYIEVHHIERLADGGEDTLENTACLCPAHHREIHLAKNKDNLKTALKDNRDSLGHKITE